MMYRQGDVLIESVDEIPKTAAPVERVNGRVVLALGEVTGHSHSMDDDPNVTQFREGDKQFIEVLGEKGAMLVHEEHGPIDLPPGRYEVGIQREYEPTGRESGGSRSVYD